MLGIAIFWTLLTIWAECTGPKRSWELGNQPSRINVLIVYDPDPFYNLDEQVSRSFGQALANQGLAVRVATVAAANEFKDQPVDLYVFCANTYNWRPDWAVSNFIEQKALLANKPVVAITLGSGSTDASQKALEKLIRDRKGILLDSRSLWLSRPNDESRLNESNTQVAVSMARKWGQKIAQQIKY
ncbi:hypothetical protein HMF3257_20395 [Spirosoma telluris]|uniref:Flavodoxin-like domain-containing protein n=1 Tax=Spirosoma telluris TaxID=2183553 RepID=A0A327NT73_9BACT|nr:hypothetical protein HMF3257_20395 [Spirosoma telluris]